VEVVTTELPETVVFVATELPDTVTGLLVDDEVDLLSIEDDVAVLVLVFAGFDKIGVV
jgi:hypothetical protein